MLCASCFLDPPSPRSPAQASSCHSHLVRGQLLITSQNEKPNQAGYLAELNLQIWKDFGAFIYWVLFLMLNFTYFTTCVQKSFCFLTHSVCAREYCCCFSLIPSFKKKYALKIKRRICWNKVTFFWQNIYVYMCNSLIEKEICTLCKLSFVKGFLIVNFHHHYFDR